jgi:hypothetical protein
MVARKNLDRRDSILKLVKAGYKAIEIARELSVGRTLVSYHIKKMIEEGLILSENMGIYHKLTLTARGGVAMLNTHPNPTKRFHAYGLRYQRLGTLKGALEPAQIFREAKEASVTITNLNNTTQATIRADITTKLTTKSLILYAPALYYHRGAPSITMEAEAKRVLDEEAERWERKLGIKLRRARLGVLWSEVIQEEIADEGHELGKAAVPDGGQVVLARHRDNKPRLTGDWSTGRRPELETVHRSSAGEDSDMVDRQFNAVLDGNINLFDIKKIEMLEDKVLRLAEVEERYRRQIELHLKVMKKIDERLNQRKLSR